MRTIRILLIATFLVVAGWTVQAQHTGDQFLTIIDHPVLTAQQQHYLNTIQDYNQYVSHQIVQIQPEALDRNFVDLQLDHYLTVKMIKQQVNHRAQNDYSWFGKIEDRPESSAIIVVHDKMVSANIRFDGLQYSLWPLDEGLHALTFENPANLEDHGSDYDDLPVHDMQNAEQESHFDGEIQHYFPREQERAVNAGGRSNHECAIRLLVAFTDDVDAANADPRGQIQLAVDNFNNANNNSGVGWDAELARVVEVSYAEANNFTTDRDRFMNNGDGYMDQIHALRSLYDADYCQLVLQNSSPGCGLAAGIGSSYGTAFCASEFGCIAGNLTFAHEFGHLHGCRHDTYVDNNNSPYSNGHGHVNVPDMWRTVMAYNTQCSNLNTSCTRLQYWSTPDEYVPSSWGGDVCGVAGVSDNEAVLDYTDIQIFSYEGLVTNKSVYSSDVIIDDEEGNFQGATTISTPSNAGSVYLDYRSGSKGEFKASDRITLNPGFLARTGATFTARLESCAPITTKLRPAVEKPKPQHLAQESAEASMAVFPNPFRQTTTIVFVCEEHDGVTLEVIDPAGRVVWKNPVELKKGSNRFGLDLSRLPAGAYQVIARGDRVAQTRTVLKFQ